MVDMHIQGEGKQKFWIIPNTWSTFVSISPNPPWKENINAALTHNLHLL